MGNTVSRITNTGNYLVNGSFDEWTGAPVADSSLQLWLDAGQSASYPGTGNTWTDLSGKNNNGTIQTGVTYNSLGYFSFNGAGGYVSLPTTNLPYGSTSSTICGWALTNTNSGSYSWVFSYGSAYGGASRFIGINSSSYVFGGYGSDIGASGVPLKQWVYMVEVYDGATAYMYVNGVLLTSSVLTWNTVVGNAQIGRQTNTGEYWNGNISNVMVYNRALSASEVSQNFNALRGRYGI